MLLMELDLKIYQGVKSHKSKVQRLIANPLKSNILSIRWRKLLIFVPLPDLDIILFPDYIALVSFVDRFLNFSRASCLHKLKLSIRMAEDDHSCVTW